MTQSGVTADEAERYHTWAADHGNTAAALACAGTQHETARFAAASSQILAVDHAGRTLVIGSQINADGIWFLRAVDAFDHALVWQTPLLGRFATCPGLGQMGLRDAGFYLAVGGTICAFDADTGAFRWQFEHGSDVRTDAGLVAQGDELELFEVVNAEGRRAVVFQTDVAVFSLDSGTGDVLWTRDWSNRIRPFPGVGVARCGGDEFELVDAVSGESMFGVPAGEFEAVCVFDDLILVQVHDYGDDDRAGLLLIERSAPISSCFVPVAGADVRDAVLVESDSVHVPVYHPDGTRLLHLDRRTPLKRPGLLARLLGGKSRAGSARRLPWKGWSCQRMVAAGSSLFVEASPDDGDTQISVLDAATLQQRYRSEPLTNTAFPNIRAGDGYFAYRVRAGDEDELRMISAAGEKLWSKRFDSYSDHCFVGDLLILHLCSNVVVLRAADGEHIGGYPRPA